MSSYLLNVFNGLLMKKTLTKLSQPRLLIFFLAGTDRAPPGCDSHLVFASKSRIFARWKKKDLSKFLCCHWNCCRASDKLVKLSIGSTCCVAPLSRPNQLRFATLKHSICRGHLERVGVIRDRNLSRLLRPRISLSFFIKSELCVYFRPKNLVKPLKSKQKLSFWRKLAKHWK